MSLPNSYSSYKPWRNSKYLRKDVGNIIRDVSQLSHPSSVTAVRPWTKYGIVVIIFLLLLVIGAMSVAVYKIWNPVKELDKIQSVFDGLDLNMLKKNLKTFNEVGDSIREIQTLYKELPDTLKGLSQTDKDELCGFVGFLPAPIVKNVPLIKDLCNDSDKQ
jgi:hypothetical protein